MYLDKKEVTKEEYQKIIDRAIQNNNPYQEQIIGARKKIFVCNMFLGTYCEKANLYIGEITDNQFNSFLGLFSKQIYKAFKNNPSLFTLKIDYKTSARSKNMDVWNSMPHGKMFFNIDFRSAYWQMAHRLGYIETKYFEKYINLDEFKQAKRFCISFLNRENKKTYSDGRIITCETKILSQIYENIRNEMYKCVQTALKGTKGYIEYNIDGVYVLPADHDIVRRNLDRMGILYKVTNCFKRSDTEFSYGGILRTFVHKPININ